MAEIKVVTSEVNPILEELKGHTAGLDTSKVDVNFGVNVMELAERLINLEQRYNEIYKAYRESLLKVEADVKSNLEMFVEKDRRLAHQLKG
ncbi:hypothetical protein N781_09070 [Pontibacillus halophilus JSM 076056 = DSM 19796]|uniref:Uncharacterized protein n=1 Tax=Pontibacillus halophilus JSM 076056 = DSM 19796 TaxID=1385510 RepID=A0A0A5GCU0_9BACI|nr:DUF5344 family protein [Pontibacillus halophilus]KGX89859.1 hypothetical protein N781_09070 [Pontibacillus halophilus JSM 076056 = DSM 19796]